MVDNNNSSDPLGQHKCGSLEVAGETSGGGGQELVTAHSVDCDLDQPRGRLRTKWHRRQTWQRCRIFFSNAYSSVPSAWIS